MRHLITAFLLLALAPRAWADACDHADRAKDPEALRKEGIELIKSKKLDEALAKFRCVHETLEPKATLVLYNLGVAYEMKKDADGAFYFYCQYLERDAEKKYASHAHDVVGVRDCAKATAPAGEPAAAASGPVVAIVPPPATAKPAPPPAGKPAPTATATAKPPVPPPAAVKPAAPALVKPATPAPAVAPPVPPPAVVAAAVAPPEAPAAEACTDSQRTRSHDLRWAGWTTLGVGAAFALSAVGTFLAAHSGASGCDGADPTCDQDKVNGAQRLYGASETLLLLSLPALAAGTAMVVLPARCPDAAR